MLHSIDWRFNVIKHKIIAVKKNQETVKSHDSFTCYKNNTILGQSAMRKEPPTYGLKFWGFSSVVIQERKKINGVIHDEPNVIF